MRIRSRYNGPPGSGNGGYCSGVFAGALAPGYAAATVTLRRPPPLDVALDVRAAGDGVEIFHRDRLVASAEPAAAPAAVVDPVPVEAARRASDRYPGFTDHPFPTCYVCGPARDDGLRIFAGPVGDGRTAAVWRVPPDVARETVWAALDCPGGWTIVTPGRPYVLARMTCAVRAVPAPGSQCVVVGGLVGIEGRKARVRTALFDPAGAPIAVAAALWLAI